ncbi:spindle pole body component 110-like [Ctenocephalides felis]|uniref:spindle pole body component 110-like n=1 Tax=Ctenocephalides felis TaxID=7515 RepID=UPI000E6E30DA|nr:spindle pole body component 110-like [Ctenocephalides felis]
MAEDDIIYKWNEVMEGFKLNENFFKDSNATKIVKALEELCIYCKFDINAMKQCSQFVIAQKFSEMGLASPEELEPIFNILKFIFRTYAIITTGRKTLCLYDVYLIGPKRLNRIFQELFNFFLFCNIQHNKITAGISKRETRDNDLVKEIEDLDAEIEAFEKEFKAIDSKIQKCKSTYPQTEDEIDNYKQQTQDVMEDIAELEAKIQAEEEELKHLKQIGIQTQFEIDELKDQLVTDGETLTSTLELQKAELEELVKDNAAQEASMKKKINLISEKTKSIGLANNLMTEFNKCISLGEKCKSINKVIEESNANIADEIMADEILNDHKDAVNSLNLNKQKFNYLLNKREEFNKSAQNQHNEIIKEIQIRLDKCQRLEEETKNVATSVKKVETTILEIENCKKQDMAGLERFEKLVLELIKKMHEKFLKFEKEIEMEYQLKD